MITRIPAAILLLFAIVFIEVGTSDASEKIVLQLAWKHQFQFAGYYAALHKGYYRQAGLDVTIVEGGNGKFAREEVLSGRAQYGVACVFRCLAAWVGICHDPYPGNNRPAYRSIWREKTDRPFVLRG
ncbi:ABC transporter substrate-binding protein [Desulfotignum balticum]|uniref:ABC transporter substrate-binding protein n=1 Tax=Desulfotignum balticum TaxID=115781 RepID=UPI00146C48EC|nr:ABC transporter substrate-binding protein [Desulfotignum balticum]